MQSSPYFEMAENRFDIYSKIGAGNYGCWGSDEQKNPCYYLKSGHPIKQDVWHLIGNDRISATAHAKGYVQIYAWDRGPQVLNRHEPEKSMRAGGYTWIFSEGHQITTLMDNDTLPNRFEVIWGCGYIRKIVCDTYLYVDEKISAPVGKDPVLIHELKIKNNSDQVQKLRIIPIWEPNWFPMDPGLIMTPPYDKFWNMLRKRRGEKIQKSAEIYVDPDTLIIQYLPKKQMKNKSSWRVYPVDCFFMTSLNPKKPDGAFANKNNLITYLKLDIKHTEKFFSEKHTSSNNCNLFCFLEERDLPEEGEIDLKYLIGYGEREKIPEYRTKYSTTGSNTNNKKQICMDIPGINFPVDRELQWHSYYLQAGCVYSEYFDRYFVDQGSAYGFIHGASGAPRDWAFFIVPLIYLRPDLAREMLLFLCQLQDQKTGKLPYALVGNGKTTGAGVHSWSSDLDLFLLWSFSEYLGTTFDTSILHEKIPFRNSNSLQTANVLTHIETAFYHLIKKVGVGKHGLIRSGTGDWNDVFLAFSPYPPITMLKGESVFNSAMAVLVLPEIAKWIEAFNPQLSKDMNEFAHAQRQALARLWNGKWFPRGYFGIGDRKLGDNHLFLDVQPFAILADLIGEEEQKGLLKAIKEKCVDTQPFGATCLVPPMKGRFLEPGSDTNGGSWFAINAWLIWAWSKHNPKETWNFLLKNTLFAHAEIYPNIWYGIWSGPDAYNSAEHPRAGETFCLNFTPMTQFPIMNMNCHAGLLFSILKLAGLCPRNKALFIDPKIPFEKFKLQTPLISYSYQPGKIEIHHTPICSGEITLCIKLNQTILSSTEQLKSYLNGTILSNFSINNDGFFTLTTEAQKNTPISLLITI